VTDTRTDFAAAYPPQRVGLQIVDPAVAEQDLAGADPSRRVDQADDRRPGNRLAGARLTDDAEHFARCDREGDPVHGDERASPRREFDP
jgi:hypothetical protein